MSSKFYPEEALPVAPANDSSLHIICDFLKWAEREKGLALCEPYKAKYDWYIPIAYHSGTLVVEFLKDKA
ncbi:MAG: hypothetical protein V4528_08280 [Pseudomonadota bacterium]